MNKICTTIEQSKKLIELGLNPESADMCYRNTYFTSSMVNTDTWELLVDDLEFDADIPAWSLTALLGLMPFHIIENNVRYEFQIVKGLNKEGGTYKIKYKGYTSFFETLMYNNPIDAAFEMICWLKENNKI